MEAMTAPNIDQILDQQAELSAEIIELAKSFEGKSVQWGIDDCSMWPAHWIAQRTGTKVSIPRYDSEDQARNIIKEYGGLVNLWDHVAQQNGIQKRYEASGIETGDVGVIRMTKFDMGCVFVKYATIAVVRSENGYRPIGIRKKHILAGYRIP